MSADPVTNELSEFCAIVPVSIALLYSVPLPNVSNLKEFSVSVVVSVPPSRLNKIKSGSPPAAEPVTKLKELPAVPCVDATISISVVGVCPEL